MSIVLRCSGPLEASVHPETERSLFVDSVDQWLEDFKSLAKLGVHHVFIQLRAPIKEHLEAMAELRRRIR